MTQSLKQIEKQIEALQRQAEKLRQQEVGGVVARIKEAIGHYGLTAPQLFGEGSDGGERAAPKSARGVSTRAAKFGDDEGNTWSGRGPRPHWLRDALAAGKSLEQFAVAGLPFKAKSAAKASKKRKPRILYRDDAGHTWSGMGPKPRWLKEAIEAGQTLEQLSA